MVTMCITPLDDSNTLLTEMTDNAEDHNIEPKEQSTERKTAKKNKFNISEVPGFNLGEDTPNSKDTKTSKKVSKAHITPQLNLNKQSQEKAEKKKKIVKNIFNKVKKVPKKKLKLAPMSGFPTDL